MSLTPLTPAEVGGEFDEGEIRALHLKGPHVGKVLVYKKADPELLIAQDANEIIVEGPRLRMPPPEFITLPTISGQKVVGSTLTVDDGTWSGSPTGFTHRWTRDGNLNFIPGATSSTYKLVAEDVGAMISVMVTASNEGGDRSIWPLAVGPVTAAP